MDQALVLFGRPQKITAFVENIRGLGSKEVDDCVSPRPAFLSSHDAN